MWIVALTAAVVAAGPYSVFNPTPDSELRELATDRPDVTESAVTVDAGHVQVEADVLAVSVAGPFDGRAARDDVSATFMAAIVKVGLLSSVDLQLVLPALDVSSKAGRIDYSSERAGMRVKWNLLGNDGGGFQLALMPFVSHRFEDGAMEGGVVAPMAVALPAGFSMGMQAQVDAVKVGKVYDVELLWTTGLSHALPFNAGAYVEGVMTTRPYDVAASRGAISSGVTWRPVGDIQLDGGVRSFVIGADPELVGFLGFTVRR
jgi:hypothetical protein